MKVNRDQAKNILQKLTPQELEIYKQLNNSAKDLNEAEAPSFVNNIKSNWKNWSTAMLMAIMMNPSISSAINKEAPDVYNDIKTEISSTKPSTPKGKTVASADFTQTFQSGKSLITNPNELKTKIFKLKDWVKKNKGRDYTITIVAGESQVTNPTGMKTGELATQRAEALNKIVKGVLGKGGVIKTVIGQTPYDPKTDDKNDPKYQQEQFARIDIEVTAEDLCSFNVNAPGEEGTAQNNFITYNEYLSGEGTVSLKSGKIPDRMVIFDSNDNITHDTGYVTTDKSTYSQWKFVPKYVLGLTQIQKTGSESLKGSGIRTIRVKDFNDLVRQLSNVPNPDINAYADEVRTPLNSMKAMIEKGEKEFVIYNVMGKGAINFNETNGDSRVVVYSPLGSTGYTIKGTCK